MVFVDFSLVAVLIFPIEKMSEKIIVDRKSVI